MNTPPELVRLRAAFWPRYFRWAVAFQLAVAMLFGFGFALQVVSYGWAPPNDSYWYALGILSTSMAVVALAAAVRRRDYGCAELTERGVRPFSYRYGWDIRYGWEVLETVRVKAGPFGNRWLEVVPDEHPPFKLTAHPTDPAAVLEALERFAGEHHPLTRAYATLLEVA